MATPHVAAVDCGQPESAVDAEMTSPLTSSTYASRVTYACFAGLWFYRDTFTLTSTCQEDGRWSQLARNRCIREQSFCVYARKCSGVGTMRTGGGGCLYPSPSSGLVPLYTPSQRCGLCQNFKQTTLTARLYKVCTNLYPPHLRKCSDAPENMSYPTSVQLLPAQRHASAGTSYDPVSVSVSVCVGVLSKRMDGSSCFWHM